MAASPAHKIYNNMEITLTNCTFKLRSPTPDDAEFHYKLLTNKQVMKYDRIHNHYELGEDAASKQHNIGIHRKQIQQSIQKSQNGPYWAEDGKSANQNLWGMVEFVIEGTEGADKGKRLGWTGVHSFKIDPEAPEDKKLGTGLQARFQCVLETEYQGKGLATKCLRLMTQFAFEKLEDAGKYYINKFESVVHKENQALIHIMEKKAGWKEPFPMEKTEDEHLISYRITKDEYLKKNPFADVAEFKHC
ncbi:Acyl-CoA N-acyltransferases (Nat) [Glarea lozoyensis ATCC 20868]|uniref:Acyl-CoA N-acyltransferases (Nat) n=1 Tax=Glarea lozoyensis (strain ATCC 20868 / MF5171) TaxID=1116229 RepID=S3DJV6_GLAL2|nr:Acyl-CoA N-acyltransferases (Nat) [Glarea lozoyensis ATCC 20868]EPE32321.1 Acyl-CoA N-acyltransferases (Nat) [Glarea lozoyensis ATCC 20868]